MATSYSIHIHLAENTLTLRDKNGEKVLSFPVIFGRNSWEGVKEREGDQRTPRGDYRICTINEQSKFTLFFGLSYPGEKDALAALVDGRISNEQYREIMKAHRENHRPPWNTPLGGEVGIHGGGIDRDGTRGCIGMRDEDVIQLKPYISPGTPVVIK